jgi:5-dehydro-4-deoxyglucarate dehydratase
MIQMLAPDVLRHRIRKGIMAFPATPFHADFSLDPAGYEAHVATLASHAPTALVAAGGAGEIFSLSLPEHEQIVKLTVQNANGVAVIGGAAYGTPLACEMARAVERAGADAVLLFPPYLVSCEQEGLSRHIREVCESVSISVIPYSRDNAVIEPLTLIRLAEVCPNLAALKDGASDLEGAQQILQQLGDRIAIVNGAPTAEVMAAQFRDVGVHSYSSAVFTFLPQIAKRYFAALQDDDRLVQREMLEEFYEPLVALRERKRGFAVSIVKAGLRVVGTPAGPVRAPLIDLNAEEEAVLRALVQKAAQWNR